ncbi:MAG: ferredoxin [Bacteroidetes bacterium]|nr:ferredoxin [Bacteroidota bacterium]
MLRIIFQRQKCIGCGSCVEVAPDRWQMNKLDGKSILIDAKGKKGFYTIELTNDEYEQNKEVESSCPMHIIRVEKC